MTTTTAFTPREASMIRAALREKAGAYRRMAGRRTFAGPANVELRARARDEAAAYDRLSNDVRLS